MESHVAYLLIFYVNLENMFVDQQRSKTYVHNSKDWFFHFSFNKHSCLIENCDDSSNVVAIYVKLPPIKALTVIEKKYI